MHMDIDHDAALAEADCALLRLALAARDLGYRFITPTPCTHERVNARPGNEWAADLRGVLGWSRPFKAGLLSATLFEMMQQAGILHPVEGGWQSRLRLSSLDDQLYWHSAHPTTQADAVFFGPDTYRFAQAIRHCLDGLHAPIRRAFDMGCGSGAGALSVALARPAAEVHAGDINASALRLAQVNAAIAGAGNVSVRHSDMLGGMAGDFDLIVANPPYLNDSLGRAYRHGGGSHGQELAVAMLAAALPRLSPGGTMLLYTGTAFVSGRDTFLEAARRVLDHGPQQGSTDDSGREPFGVKKSMTGIGSDGESNEMTNNGPDARMGEPNGKPGDESASETGGKSGEWQWTYREVDPDVFGEELDKPAYMDAERIAAVVLLVSSR